MNKILIFILSCMLLTSCVAVREYEKFNLNDADMALKARKSLKFVGTFQVYREGAAGASDGKSGGGCGCN